MSDKTEAPAHLEPDQEATDLERLLALDGLSSEQREALFSEALDGLEEAGSLRDNRWVRGLAASTIALAAAFVLSVLPNEPEFTSRGGNLSVDAEVVCRPAQGSESCGPGGAILIAVHPSEDLPFVRVWIRDPLGYVVATLPAAGEPAIDTRELKDGLLPKKYVLEASDGPGRYEVEVRTYAESSGGAAGEAASFHFDVGAQP